MGFFYYTRRFIFPFLLTACALFAQTTSHKTDVTRASEKPSARAAILQQILDQVSSVPPELAAYAQLKVVEARGINQADQLIPLVESSFRLAVQSPYQVRMTSGGAGSEKAGYLAAALDQGLDTLSLQSEAVMAMLKLEPERARDLFQQMRPLHLELSTCSDSLLHAPSAYYRAARAVYSEGFNKEEQANGLAADFLESVFREVSQAGETAPAAGMLYELHLDPDQQSRMEAAFARSLGNIRGDSRSFYATQSMLIAYVIRMARNTGRSHRVLLDGLRIYLVANASEGACQDATRTGPPLNATATDPFTQLTPLFQQYGIKPITTEEIRPASIAASSQSPPPAYWSSTEAKQLRADNNALRDGTDAADKTSLQWQNRAESFLMELRGWIDPSTEPSADDFYIEKALLYAELVATAPVDTAAYNEALSAYVSFLSDQPPSDDVRIFQLWSMREIVQRGRRDRGSTSQKRQELEAATHNAPNPSIAMYGYLLALEDARSADERAWR